jgi:protein-disulfide isomerase
MIQKPAEQWGRTSTLIQGCKCRMALFTLTEAVAAKLGVIGTPTYFINGAKIDGARVGELERLLGGEKIPFDAGDPD